MSAAAHCLPENERSREFAAKWRDWSSTQPQYKRCAQHNRERFVNADLSMRVSWRQREFVMVYFWCPECKKEKKTTP